MRSPRLIFFKILWQIIMDTGVKIKEKIRKLYEKTKELDSLQQEIDDLKADLLIKIKEQGLTKTKFDFADKSIKYRQYVDKGQISQKLLSEVIIKNYPHIDATDFITSVLAARKPKEREIIEVVKR